MCGAFSFLSSAASVTTGTAVFAAASGLLAGWLGVHTTGTLPGWASDHAKAAELQLEIIKETYKEKLPKVLIDLYFDQPSAAQKFAKKINFDDLQQLMILKGAIGEQQATFIVAPLKEVVNYIKNEGEPSDLSIAAYIKIKQIESKLKKAEELNTEENFPSEDSTISLNDDRTEENKD